MAQPKKSGQSFVEYLAIMLFVLAAFWIFQKYIARGFSGRWKSVGESIGQGRIYDPRRTTECVYDAQYGTNLWYEQSCFKNSCTHTCSSSSLAYELCVNDFLAKCSSPTTCDTKSNPSCSNDCNTCTYVCFSGSLWCFSLKTTFIEGCKAANCGYLRPNPNLDKRKAECKACIERCADTRCQGGG